MAMPSTKSPTTSNITPCEGPQCEFPFICEEPAEPVNAIGVSHFQQYLRLAFAQQHLEHEKSMNNFVSTVAMLCEQSGATAPMVAETLRALPIVGGMSNINESKLSSDVVVDGAAVNEQRLKKMKQQQVSSSFDTNGAARITQDNKIQHLPFLGPSGEMVKPPSSMERICGPSYSTMKQRVRAPFERCQPRTGMCMTAIDGFPFKMLTMLVIVLNFVFIIVQSDYKASHLNQADSSTMVSIGYAFTAFYIFELCALMFVHGKDFFVGPEMGWNLFDSAIVLVAIFDILMGWLGVEGFNMSFLRILRFFKISRVLRMFSALRAFKEIRIMVDALAGCLSLFLFCACLMTIFLSVFAIFFVQGVSELLESDANLDAVIVADLRTNWSSVSIAMERLFMSITGGVDWHASYDSVKQVGGLHAFLFLFFVCFYYIAFFNVITSVFCEKAMSLATPTPNELIARQIEKEHHDAAELMSLLRSFLTDDGSLCSEQVAEFVNDPEVELYFNVRGLKSTSALKLHRMLCETHGTDKLQIGEFVSALVKLDGAANSMDAHCLHVHQLHGLNQMQAVQKEQSEDVAALRAILQGMQPSAPIAHVSEHSPLSSNIVQHQDTADTLSALSMVNETLKVLKKVVQHSVNDSTIGDETLQVVNQLMPLCCSSAESLKSDTNLDIDGGFDSLEGAPIVLLEGGPLYFQQARELNTLTRVRGEISEVHQSLEQIQQKLQAFSQSKDSSDTSQASKSGTFMLPISDGYSSSTTCE